MRFTCPTCNQLIQVADNTTGQTVACPTCRQRVKVPPSPSAGPRPASVDKTLLGKVDDDPPAAQIMSDPPRYPEPPPAARPRERGRDENWDDRNDERDHPRRRRYLYEDEERRQSVRREPEENMGLAVASLVCGIVAIVFSWCVFIGPLCGLLAVIFGGIHLSNKATYGNGLAVSGLSTGAVGIVFFVVFLLIMISSRNSPFWFGR